VYQRLELSNTRFTVNLVILDLLSLLSSKGRRADACGAAFLSAFRDGIGRIFKTVPIANDRHENSN
jgi:hypothetical protein